MLEFKTIETTSIPWRVKLRACWTLVKDLQTGLLLITGLAGYMSGRPANLGWGIVLALLGSLFLTVGGSTVLNMVIDREIDGRMARTAKRPLPAGTVAPGEGLLLGVVMVLLGTLWASHLSPLYGGLVLGGVFFDVLIYTLWLKRRTPWSIVWGGIAGGMPVLAGRALATGQVDLIGLMLALAVLLWIPTHIMTFSIKYAGDYRNAGVPVFPNVYGERSTRLVIGVSTITAVFMMLATVYLIGVSPGLLWAARGLGVLLSGFSVASILHTTPRLNFILYKLASTYMLASMLVLIAGA